MDIQKELIKMEKEHTKIRTKFGNKFVRYYEDLVALVSGNTRRIDDLVEANRQHHNTLAELKTALAATETEV